MPRFEVIREQTEHATIEARTKGEALEEAVKLFDAGKLEFRDVRWLTRPIKQEIEADNVQEETEATE